MNKTVSETPVATSSFHDQTNRPDTIKSPYITKSPTLHKQVNKPTKLPIDSIPLHLASSSPSTLQILSNFRQKKNQIQEKYQLPSTPPSIAPAKDSKSPTEDLITNTSFSVLLLSTPPTTQDPINLTVYEIETHLTGHLTATQDTLGVPPKPVIIIDSSSNNTNAVVPFLGCACLNPTDPVQSEHRITKSTKPIIFFLCTPQQQQKKEKKHEKGREEESLNKKGRNNPSPQKETKQYKYLTCQIMSLMPMKQGF